MLYFLYSPDAGQTVWDVTLAGILAENLYQPQIIHDVMPAYICNHCFQKFYRHSYNIAGGKDYRTVKKRKGFTIWQDLT